MAMTAAAFGIAWFITLSGGLMVCGGLAALTSDADTGSMIGPYRLAWTAWSLEVVGLLLALAVLVFGTFRHWRATILFCYAAVSPIFITLTNDVLMAKSGLPGSNGSDTRANTVAAGLILVVAGNYMQAIATALHDSAEPRIGNDGATDSPKGMV